MAALPSITRRFALKAFPFIAAIAAAPVIMTQELKAAPVADKGAALLNFLATAEPRDVAQYHALELAKTMQRMNGGAWRLSMDEMNEFVLVVRDRDMPGASVTQDFL